MDDYLDNDSLVKSKYKKNKPNQKISKRHPGKEEENNSTIYVSTKSSLKALLALCKKKIVNYDLKELTIYCLGAAIQRGILLALKLCEQHIGFQIHTNTLTSELVDDLEPTADDEDYEIQIRYNSALKIKLFKNNLFQDTPEECSSQSMK